LRRPNFEEIHVSFVQAGVLDVELESVNGLEGKRLFKSDIESFLH
jgi:hypothetical protein